MKALKFISVVNCSVLGLVSIAYAAPTETFLVSASIEEGCLISGTQVTAGSSFGTLGILDFGSTSSLSDEVLNTQLVTDGAFELTCTPGLDITMSINGGNNLANGNRRLSHATAIEAEPIIYRMYLDSALTEEININNPVTLTRTGDELVLITLYGQVMLTGQHQSGNYYDEVTVTIEW